MTARLAAALFAAALCSCAREIANNAVIPGLAGASRVYTLTVLHPDDEDRRLYAANFQQFGTIPICSEVKLLRYRSPPKAYLTFRLLATGAEYEYDDHDAAAEPFTANLARYFGRECPRAELDALDELERRGVAMGEVLPGMRRQAVILALGYPPKRDTPALDAQSWRYWRDHFRYFTVRFGEDGRVAEVSP
ncbi:MAG TPA: hypothetical protein VEN47_15400 [Myxococcota bacterium]|nr:hypothetical protein [Myxococcota bacterium]